MGAGSVIMDIEDFIVSNNLLPLGSMVFVLFCVLKHGWGWDNFLEEANTGKGLAFPKILKNYCKFGIPILIVAIFVFGYINTFQ
jgi:NSS family neurotransmitter:Na+ symporter